VLPEKIYMFFSKDGQFNVIRMSEQRQYNWYLLLLSQACSIKEKKQRLVGSQSDH
jgi:hypothetical protein